MTHADAGMSAYSVGPSEPVCEYRVVCADGEWRLRHLTWTDRAEWVPAMQWCGPHDHTIECRPVGPWEAT